MNDAQKVTAAAIVAALAALGAGLALKGDAKATKEAPAFESALEVDVSTKELDPESEAKFKVREYSTDAGRIYAYEADGGLVQAPPQCVIPACDETEAKVNCKCNGRWSGCNTCPKEAASGDECKPASCWFYFGEVEAAAK